MLSIINKLLTVQIITTTTLITCVLLSGAFPTTDSLPITSKPIESTAENLAWEAWLMVPVGQQQKSRKVTPKSIFIVPQKRNQTSLIQCPPGEHLFESGCIPTVNIDTEKILLTQLTNLVLTSGDYDYDYDEDGNDTPGAEKLEGGLEVIPSSIVNTADEPLKFDIFRDNFPIGAPGSGDSSGSKDSDDENVFFVSERRRRPPMPPIPPEPELADLDTDGTEYGSHNQSVEDDAKGPEEDSTLFLSGIDAILVPAVPAVQQDDQNINFTIFQKVSNTNIANSAVAPLIPVAEKKLEQLEQILENESLFLVKEEEDEKTTTQQIETTTELFDGETTTLKLEEDEDVESKTEYTRSVTEVLTVEEDTTFSSTDSTEITSTLIADENTIPTTMIPSEGTAMTTDSGEEITTITSGSSELEPQSSTNSDLNDRSSSLPSVSEERFVYHRLTDEKTRPPVIDLQSELKMINDLVAGRRQPSIKTTAAPSKVEPAAIDRWTNIIPSPNAISTSSVVPVLSSSSSPIRSTTSTSKNILSNSSSSSSSSSSTTSSTDSQGGQRSSVDPSSPKSSTSQTPVISESSPFWWLPTGWRVDRTDADRPLLLRFLSALSGIGGSQTKV